jgi:hypothetical protein
LFYFPGIKIEIPDPGPISIKNGKRHATWCCFVVTMVTMLANHFLGKLSVNNMENIFGSTSNMPL